MPYEPISLDTVRVASDDFESGFVIINASDFNEEVHTLYVESGEDAGEVAAAEAAVAPKRKRG